MKRAVGFLGASLMLLTLAMTPLVATAATGSSGLSITPRKDYIINPGQTITDKLTIGNLSKEFDLSVNLRLIDFTFTDQSGTPKLFLADNAPQTAWSLKPFTTLPKSVVVPAGQTKTVNYSITVPKNQGAGSYYSAIMYQAGGTGAGNVALNASGVTLAFVSVPGIVHEDLRIQKFGAYVKHEDQAKKDGKFVFIAVGEAPQMMGFTVKNEGNVAESPAGSITLKDMFGKQVKTIGRTNETQALALIGQTRLFTTCIKTVQQKIEEQGGTSSNTTCTDPQLKPGRYTATLDLFYGQNGNETHEIAAKATFWYLPIWFLAILLGLIVLLVVIVLWVRRKLQSLTGGRKSSQFKSHRRR